MGQRCPKENKKDVGKLVDHSRDLGKQAFRASEQQTSDVLEDCNIYIDYWRHKKH